MVEVEEGASPSERENQRRAVKRGWSRGGESTAKTVGDRSSPPSGDALDRENQPRAVKPRRSREMGSTVEMAGDRPSGASDCENQLRAVNPRWNCGRKVDIEGQRFDQVSDDQPDGGVMIGPQRSAGGTKQQGQTNKQQDGLKMDGGIISGIEKGVMDLEDPQIQEEMRKRRNKQKMRELPPPAVHMTKELFRLVDIPCSSSQQGQDLEMAGRKLVLDTQIAFANLYASMPGPHAAPVGKAMRKEGLLLMETIDYIGLTPGVKVGDAFRYRAQLPIINLHRAEQEGISCTTAADGSIVCNSIVIGVKSGGYLDLVSEESVIYCGCEPSEEKKKKKKKKIDEISLGKQRKVNEEQQEKVRKYLQLNLALARSCKLDSPVRVIVQDGKSSFYVYKGLFTVTWHWKTADGKFRFRLVRLPGTG